MRSSLLLFPLDDEQTETQESQLPGFKLRQLDENRSAVLWKSENTHLLWFLFGNAPVVFPLRVSPAHSHGLEPSPGKAGRRRVPAMSASSSQRRSS